MNDCRITSHHVNGVDIEKETLGQLILYPNPEVIVLTPSNKLLPNGID